MSKRDELSTMGERKSYNFNRAPAPPPAKKPKKNSRVAAVVSSTTVVTPKPRPASLSRSAEVRAESLMPKINGNAALASVPPDMRKLLKKVESTLASAPSVRSSTGPVPRKKAGTETPPVRDVPKNVRNAMKRGAQESDFRIHFAGTKRNPTEFEIAGDTESKPRGARNVTSRKTGDVRYLGSAHSRPPVKAMKNGGRVRGDGMSTVKTKGKCC